MLMQMVTGLMIGLTISVTLTVDPASLPDQFVEGMNIV
jgi:hypothetical protein